MNAIPRFDRRDDDRVPYASRVMIVRGESAWFAQLLDASAGGCGLYRPADCMLQEDELVRLFFYQDDGTTVVIVPARVARVGEHLIGVEYHEPQTVPPRALPDDRDAADTVRRLSLADASDSLDRRRST